MHDEQCIVLLRFSVTMFGKAPRSGTFWYNLSLGHSPVRLYEMTIVILHFDWAVSY